MYDKDLLPNGSPVILRKNSGYKSPLYIPRTPEHEEALAKDGDEPGRASSTKDSSSSDESVVSSDSEDQDTVEQNSKKVGDGDNEERADANDSAGEEHDSSDLRAALRKEIEEFYNKSNELLELATDFLLLKSAARNRGSQENTH